MTEQTAPRDPAHGGDLRTHPPTPAAGADPTSPAAGTTGEASPPLDAAEAFINDDGTVD